VGQEVEKGRVPAEKPGIIGEKGRKSGLIKQSRGGENRMPGKGGGAKGGGGAEVPCLFGQRRGEQEGSLLEGLGRIGTY